MTLTFKLHCRSTMQLRFCMRICMTGQQRLQMFHLQCKPSQSKQRIGSTRFTSSNSLIAHCLMCGPNYITLHQHGSCMLGMRSSNKASWQPPKSPRSWLTAGLAHACTLTGTLSRCPRANNQRIPNQIPPHLFRTKPNCGLPLSLVPWYMKWKPSPERTEARLSGTTRSHGYTEHQHSYSLQHFLSFAQTSGGRPPAASVLPRKETNFQCKKEETLGLNLMEITDQKKV